MPIRKPQPPFIPIINLPGPERYEDTVAKRIIPAILADVRDTMNTERSRKKSIGPSEIGTPCMKCLARKVSMQFPKPAETSGWKAQIGTFGHAGLEEHFGSIATQHATHFDRLQKRIDRFVSHIHEVDPTVEVLLEQRVQIWKYKDFDLNGSCDMFLKGEGWGMVVDWKFQGPAMLKKSAKGDVKPEYAVQMPTYGLGFELLGFDVTHTCLFALPRDGELEDSKPILQRYDDAARERVAARLLLIKGMIDSAEIVGWQAIVNAQPSDPGCWDCPGYETQGRDAFLQGLTGK